MAVAALAAGEVAQFNFLPNMNRPCTNAKTKKLSSPTRDCENQQFPFAQCTICDSFVDPYVLAYTVEPLALLAVPPCFTAELPPKIQYLTQ